MIYREREELAILKLQDNEESLSFERLEKIISNKPSNIIYCERNEKLYGIVTMGDIIRESIEGKKQVTINNQFMYLTKTDYMKARKIFLEKKSINALPVVGEEKTLVGDWSRWDDALINNYIDETGGGYDGCHVAFVHPCNTFPKKVGAFYQCCKNLKVLGVEVECIYYDEIIKYQDVVDYILFLDQDELRAFSALYGYMTHQCDVDKKFVTYRNYNNYVYWGKLLSIVKLKGVNIYNIIFERDKYYYEMIKKIRSKFFNIGEKPSIILHPTMYKEFFGEIYSEEDADWIAHLINRITVESGSGRMKNYKSRFFNVTDGERYTAEQPLNYKNTIYFVGRCFGYGAYVEDKNTIESFLQKKINELDYNVKVVNFASPSHINMSMQLSCVLNLPLKKGDIVILYANDKHLRNIPEINLTDALKANAINPGWMVDDPRHCNDKMNNLYADIILENIKQFLSKTALEQVEYIKLNGDGITNVYLDRYFLESDLSKYSNIGSIVMNCNPFTYGHRYLIEQALNIVDYLIIFVVEEDKSFFSFDERFMMVCEGVADLENVKVVPSGPFILSQITFPEYFIKTADEDLVENVENDITLFAEKIAPCLNIKYRFVGEELEDEVTNQYNLAMKKILPKHDIKVVEIPRKEQEGRYISASSVRKCLEDDNRYEIKKLVPESTLRVLFEK